MPTKVVWSIHGNFPGYIFMEMKWKLIISTGLYGIIRPQVFANGLSLGRRLYDNKVFHFIFLSYLRATRLPGFLTTIPWISINVSWESTSAVIIPDAAIKSSTSISPFTRSAAMVRWAPDRV